jgi:pimeloyl-ACP methyl ester carboxylesterase
MHGSDFMSYDPHKTSEKVTIPVLALNGSLDYQVISDQLSGMEAFGESEQQRRYFKILGLNHLFQNATPAVGQSMHR